MKLFTMTAVAIALSVSQASALADDGESAELYKERCSSCHDTGIHTRPNHNVTNLDALGAQVRRCNSSVPGEPWFDDEIDAVVDYLNKNFYKF